MVFAPQFGHVTLKSLLWVFHEYLHLKQYIGVGFLRVLGLAGMLFLYGGSGV